MERAARITAALAALAEGRLVAIVTEPGSDTGAGSAALIAGADGLQVSQIARLVRLSGGIICAAMPMSRLEQLRIPRQVDPGRGERGRTDFAVSVDLKVGISTGISARDRTMTLRALAQSRTIPEDLVRPGHVLPIICSEGGVLDRPAGPEAAVDLCSLAGLTAFAVLAPLSSDRVGEAGVDMVYRLARDEGIPWATVADVARHRRLTESHVVRDVPITLPTPHGVFHAVDFGYAQDGSDHLVLYMGDPAGDDVLVRVHAECVAGDVLGSKLCMCAAALEASLTAIGREGRGVLIYLRGRDKAGVGMAHLVHGCARRNERDETIAAHILRDLGVRSATLLTDSPLGAVGPTGFGVTINRRRELFEPTHPPIQGLV
jgi:3,4-dihydroxy 2-butanone 4-phosphate synthase/GTP cyclohydrolase II